MLLVFSRHSEGAILVSHFGWVGVDLFFVLSGFLVSGLLFREFQETERVQAGRFLLRRGFKIYPQFYLMTAVTIVATLLMGTTLHTKSVIAEVLFVQNYIGGLWAHTWSLAVEEHFYLLLVVLVAFLARRTREQNPFHVLAKAIPIICVIVLAARVATWLMYPRMSDYTHIFPSHLRMDSLLMGVLLSYYHVFRTADLVEWMRRASGWIAPVSVLCLSPITVLEQSDPFVYTVGFSLVAVGFALLLLIVLYPAKRSPQPTFLSQALARLGQVSYAFYLWHGPILFVDDRVLARVMTKGITISVWTNLVLTLVVTVLVAFCTTWLIEQPFLRLRDRWFPSRMKAPRAAEVNVCTERSTNISPVEV